MLHFWSTNIYKNILEDNINILELMNNEEYFTMLRSLNKKQREIYDYIIYRKIVHLNKSFYYFLPKV